MAHVSDIVLSVPDVSCEHCVKAINGALGQRQGVEEVQVDIPTKTVHLKFDDEQISLATIEEILDDTGYTVAK
jgi:copper chaperone